MDRRVFLATSMAIVAASPAAHAAEGDPVNWAAMNLPRLEGGPLPLTDVQGKVVLLVNTASYCGFTPQYTALEALWEKYRDKGFTVLGVPSNDFGSQEPGTAGQIKEFCDATYGIEFPMTDKLVVSGPNAHPLYKWAKEQTGAAGVPRWNFHKILIGRDGRYIDWYSTITTPDTPRISAAIERALAAPST